MVVAVRSGSIDDAVRVDERDRSADGDDDTEGGADEPALRCSPRSTARPAPVPDRLRLLLLLADGDGLRRREWLLRARRMGLDPCSVGPTSSSDADVSRSRDEWPCRLLGPALLVPPGTRRRSVSSKKSSRLSALERERELKVRSDADEWRAEDEALPVDCTLSTNGLKNSGSLPSEVRHSRRSLHRLANRPSLDGPFIWCGPHSRTYNFIV
mmetsp:Transcript_15233/g.47546  ORF Transcript_15233/g.47546 Transcript_15233/m.47546 type:complete len:212 (+) Transcript_15233:513-1148(+)